MFLKAILFFFSSLYLIGCLNKEIEITSQYIRNANWDNVANSIKINKMQVKNNFIFELTDNVEQADLLENLEDDTTFFFIGNVNDNGIKYASRKVYFSRDNGFYWWSIRGENKTKTISNLEKNTWYKFSNLVTYPFFIYVFVDSLSISHQYEVNLANY